MGIQFFRMTFYAVVYECTAFRTNIHVAVYDYSVIFHINPGSAPENGGTDSSNMYFIHEYDTDGVVITTEVTLSVLLTIAKIKSYQDKVYTLSRKK